MWSRSRRNFQAIYIPKSDFFPREEKISIQLGVMPIVTPHIRLSLDLALMADIWTIALVGIMQERRGHFLSTKFGKLLCAGAETTMFKVGGNPATPGF